MSAIDSVIFLTTRIFAGFVFLFLSTSPWSLSLIALAGAKLSAFYPNVPNNYFQYSASYRGLVYSDTVCVMVWVLGEFSLIAFSVRNPKDHVGVRWTVSTITVG